MATIIRDGRLADDCWLRLELRSDGSVPAIPDSGDIIVPLALWRQQRAALVARDGRLGVWLDSDDNPAAIAAELSHFAVIAVNFPVFTDGRGYSIGRLLRERYGYAGELRAIGDIFRDQLHFLASCGFNSFVLREGEDAQEALGALRGFSEAYQATAREPRPLFRRRAAAVGHCGN